MVEPLCFTKEEAAEALQVSLATVNRLIERGEIPIVHLRGSVRIPKSALATWLDEQAMASLRADAFTSAGPTGMAAVELIKQGRSGPSVLIGAGSRGAGRNKSTRRAAISSGQGD